MRCADQIKNYIADILMRGIQMKILHDQLIVMQITGESQNV